MIGKKMQDAINKQINAEIYSAYLYMAMEAYFQDKDLPGFSNWMRIQAMEELTHAQRFYDHLIEREGRGEFMAIEAPPKEWESPYAAFQAAYEHEKKVTDMINGLVELAQEKKDHASANMLQWFVDEQVEEEASTSTIAKQLKMIGDAVAGLFMLDKELAQRTFVRPAKGQ